MSAGGELAWLVQERAGRRCEYSLMHQALQGATFHLEHVLPRARGGAAELGNLAWACPGCNLHKADRTDAVDPESGAVVPFFNPRADRWAEHFCFDGYQLIGQTPVGWAAVSVLGLNHPRRVLIREAEELLGLFPP